MTGKTLCSMVAGCGEKAKTADTAEAKAIQASNKEAGEKKSCCALKATAAKNKEGGCAAEANVVAASNNESAKSGCSAEVAKACGAEGAVKTASDKSGCSAEVAKACGAEGAVQTASAKSSGCCASGAKAKAVAAKSEGGCSKKGGQVVVGSGFPVVMPAMFYKADAGFCAASMKEAGCGEGKAEAKVEKVSSASGCCKSGAKVQNVAAKDPNCCKGSGVRADGKPCQNDGDHCKGEKVAEPVKAGEPVASRQ
ncbi:MAG: hypothetical protein SFZ24_00935 [Planctomycetota bacterium]|nr:hypothetical protein [Planctomycetota bacterium]